MKIMWVKANKLLPLHSGGDIRSFNLLRQLTREHEVALFSYYDGDRDRQYEDEIKKQLPGAICVSTGKAQSGLRRGLDYALRLSNAEPYAVSRFASAKVRQGLNSCIAVSRPDVIVADFLDAAINLPERLYADSSGVPLILFQHNVESEIWRRHADNGPNWAMRRMYGLESFKMLRYERGTVERFRHVIAVSEHDKALMSRWVPPERITVVPTGVDTGQFCPGVPAENDSLVLFVGAMDWEPNVDAVKYFCAEIWPWIQAKVPGARFRIVGRNPDRRVKELAGESVEVTGRVASVVEHLREAAVVVVPLRIGGGTRLKIYEAMAVGKAVVSTSVGAEGLDVNPGKDIAVADTPGAFGESVAALLTDREARRQQGAAALELARRFGWPTVANQFADVLRGAVRRGAEGSVAMDSLTSAVTEG